MKNISLLLLMILLSCTKTDKENISFFFNPASSLKTTKWHIVVSTDNQLFIDTTLTKDTKIDESILLKRFNVRKKTVLLISINDKTQLLNFDPDKQIGNRINIFTRYNDRVKIRALFEEFTKKSIKETGVIPDYLKFTDSLTANGSNFTQFDSLMVNVKPDNADNF
ncbi:hypothetical protein NF867_08530 [Solitalea sp. MAHUQ-68]|uniref:Uncharacterized protein n=1 Tax=Solitalea agri TaxID=2953739 RepID=A0A9X2F1F1_9SPHI|nr:hypothetical protein [Solitalea agri]MCO4292904.1 hypothetical protein [Solitalea agri]